MDIRLLAFYLVLAGVYLLTSTEAAAIDGQHSVSSKPVVQGRQLGEDASGEDSEEDDDEVDDNERLHNAILQQQAQEAAEDSEEEPESDDDYSERFRREATESEKQHLVEHKEDTTNAMEQKEHKEAESEPEITTHLVDTSSPATTSEVVPTNLPQSNKPQSVLILIRDALKKVTTNLPTEQVATNALQYFQLFEHFLQQTIEEVIDDDEDEDEETTTIKIDEDRDEKLPTSVPEEVKQPEPLPVIPVTPIIENVEEKPTSMGEETKPMVAAPAEVSEPKPVPEVISAEKPLIASN